MADPLVITWLFTAARHKSADSHSSHRSQYLWNAIHYEPGR